MDSKHQIKFKSWFLCFCFGLLAAMLPGNGSCAGEDHIRNYLDGTQYLEREAYKEAIEAFSAAIGQNGKEQAKVRYYGMRYGAYMPHREKGICHFHLKQYQEAIEELEISLQQLPSDEARRYLDKAKSAFYKLIQTGEIEIAKTPVELKRIREARAINQHGIGVVIGNRDYEDKDIPIVRYAIRDALMIKQYLIKTFGYRKGNIILKTNATKGTLENIFGSAASHKGTLFNYINPGRSDLFVYYSGHGAPSLETKKGFILPVDGNPNNVEISGYSLDLLYKNLARLPTRSTTVVTDACFSGARLLKNASPVGIIIKNPLAKLNNSFIICSSTGTQLSSWYPQKGHGLFTYYFLLGLTGRADQSEDNQISFEELSAFLKENVTYKVRELYQGRIQTPTFEFPDSDSILVQYK